MSTRHSLPSAVEKRPFTARSREELADTRPACATEGTDHATRTFRRQALSCAWPRQQVRFEPTDLPLGG